MGERVHVPFDVFAMRVDVPVSTAVRVGGKAWTCGQCPLTGTGEVHAPGDLPAQTEFVCDMIEAVVARAGFGTSSIGRLHVYLAARTHGEADDALALIAARFDQAPLVVPVPVPHFYYDGMLIEVDVFAADPLHVGAPTATGGVRLHLADAGDRVWAHVSTSLTDRPADDAVERITEALARHGLDQAHLLRDLWMASAGDGGMRQVLTGLQRNGCVTNPDALVRLADPAPPMLAASLSFGRQPIAVLVDGSDGDGGVRLTLKKTGQTLWASGTCAMSSLDLVGQTSRIMRALDSGLRDAGSGFADVVKLTAHYTGGATEEDLHGNMQVRHGFYQRPGPASTGLPVAGLGNEDCRIAIDVTAILA